MVRSPEVSISERNFLGRGLFAKASVTYGEYARGVSLSFVEPYLLDYRVAAGLDVFYREQIANQYISYGTRTIGFSPRLGFGLREDLSLQLRYSLYQQEITLPWQLDNCNNIDPKSAAFLPTPAYISQVLNGVDPTATPRPASYRAVWLMANHRFLFARSWRRARNGFRRSVIRSITTRSTTTRTRPTACSSTGNRTSPGLVVTSAI